MDFGGPTFVIAIIALCTAGWLINNWIRAKHGYDLEDEWGGKTPRADKSAETDALRAENAKLVDRLDDHAQRLKVLERIVTERGYSLSDEIEALRRDESSGVPIDTGRKERV
ncbi:hypothetical protein [Alteriqipengyuania lutimaris]|uniref:Envelope stress response membrane protein PspB n=1 Tax=Alteriqipengyuania lutimaris TaxID=1538146 RepID=A0A395LMC2_9SPHN|nr:hypothetical protein [Alteriqipengyuania lutimaris]MBB3032705.1 hypothetical protein [Alteriqipengyuania lutimaris]RDS78186.1 hypothetical protein DL238_11610 [Alteriqipengyuania lutimaris]